MHVTSLTPISATVAAVTTSSDTAITVLAATAKIFGGGAVINPPGGAAGQVSADNFVKDIRSLPAGGVNGSVLLIDHGGGYPNGIKVRRVPGGSDLSGVLCVMW